MGCIVADLLQSTLFHTQTMGLETVTITKPEEGGIGYVTFVSMDQITLHAALWSPLFAL